MYANAWSITFEVIQMRCYFCLILVSIIVGTLYSLLKLILFDSLPSTIDPTMHCIYTRMPKLSQDGDIIKESMWTFDADYITHNSRVL